MIGQRKPIVFLSRTSKGLGTTAAKAAELLLSRGFDVVHKPSFTMGWRKIRHLLVDKIRDCDAVLCLIGTAYGEGPLSPIAELDNLPGPLTHFSYTQIEWLLARKLKKPVVTVLFGPEFPFEAFVQTAQEAEQQRIFVSDYIQRDEHLYQTYPDEASFLDALRNAEIPFPEASVPKSKPQNIPFRSIGSLFSSRDDLLALLRAHLEVSADKPPSKITRTVILYGLGGVGKTRVVIEFAHRYACNLAACLFLRGSSPGSLTDSLAQLSSLSCLNLEEQDEPDVGIRSRAVINHLQGQPDYLLVIDNVDTEDARYAVMDLLSHLHGGRIIITSRLHTWPGNLQRIEVQPFSDREGAEFLLKYRASAKAPSHSDLPDAVALARDLGGLALALEQAAGYLNTVACTIAEYHDRWMKNLGRVHEWHDKQFMDYPASVATTWLTSFDSLNVLAQSMLQLVSWLAPDPIPRALISSLEEKLLHPSKTSVVDGWKAFGELMNYSLAQTACGGGLVVHRLVQQITRERQPAEPTPAALSSALEAVNSRFSGHSDDARQWPSITQLVPHAIKVANFGADRNIHNPSARLLSETALLLFSQANYQAAKPLFMRSLVLDKAKLGKDHPRIASSLGNLAQILILTNCRSRARIRRMLILALEIDRRHFGDNHSKVAVRLSNAAQFLANLGCYSEAEPMMIRALEIDKAFLEPNHPNIAIRLNNLAQLLVDTGRRNEAKPLMEEALRIDEASLKPNHPNIAIRLNNLAQLLADLHRYDESEPMMIRALEIDKAFLEPNHPNIAIRLNNLAQLLVDTGRRNEAKPLMEEALRIDEASLKPNHPNIAIRLNNLAQLLADLHRYDEAEPMMLRAIAISRRSHDVTHPDRALFLSNYLTFLKQMNRHAEANLYMSPADSEQTES